MQRTVARKLYLVGLVAGIVMTLFIMYKILVASLVVKLFLAVTAAICLYVPPVATPVAHWMNEIYCKLVYENSTFWELFYDLTIKLFPSADLNQINYGYAPTWSKDGVLIKDLTGRDEAERMSLQLYYRTATCLETKPDLTGATVLEVSSGRAGGIDFLSRKYGLAKAIGLDLSSNNISWCKETYSSNKKLEFVLGDAQRFVDDGTLPANSVDVVMSVDSAHLYPSFESFIDQCAKVLRPGGHLCISDFCASERVAHREQVLQNHPSLVLLKKENTTENVLHAMDLDGERRKRLLDKHANFLMRLYFRYQTGAKGSRIHNLLKGGEFTAGAWLLQKKA